MPPPPGSALTLANFSISLSPPRNIVQTTHARRCFSTSANQIALPSLQSCTRDHDEAMGDDDDDDDTTDDDVDDDGDGARGDEVDDDGDE